MTYPAYRTRFADTDVEKELDFPQAEYDRRLAAVQSAMAGRDLRLLLVGSLANICYLTGFQTPSAGTFACLFVPPRGAPVLQVIDHEYACAYYTGWITDVRTFAWYDPAAGRRQHEEILRAMAGGGLPRIGIEDSHPIALNRLAETVSADWVDCSGLVNQIRRVKSPTEIEAMRESGRIARVSLGETLDSIAVGMTDSDVAAILQARMLREGSEFVNMGPFVATGLRSSLIHTTWKRRRIDRGDLIFLEVACPYKRYNAPMMRGAVMGSASPTVQRLAAAVEDTLARLLSTIKAGRTGHEVAVEAGRGFKSIIDEIYFQGAFGYAVGLGLPPNWAEGSTPFIAEGIDEPLIAGMTLHLPVAARIVGLGGVAMSETVLVTDRGCESLTATERSFRLIGR